MRTRSYPASFQLTSDLKDPSIIRYVLYIFSRLHHTHTRISGIPTFRTRILYVPQRPSLLPGTPRDFLETISNFGSRSQKGMFGKSKDKTHIPSDFERPLEIAHGWGIDDELWDRNWGNLSGGESQRIALAVALGLGNAEILLLDGM